MAYDRWWSRAAPCFAALISACGFFAPRHHVSATQPTTLAPRLPLPLRPRVVAQQSLEQQTRAISANGAVLVTMGSVATVWNLASGLQIRHEPGARAVALSHDGMTMALVDQVLRMCPLNATECVRTPLGSSDHESYQSGFSPSDRSLWICTSEHGSVLVDVAHPDHQRRMAGCAVAAFDDVSGATIVYVVKPRAVYADVWPVGAISPTERKVGDLPEGFMGSFSLGVVSSDISSDGRSVVIAGKSGAYQFDTVGGGAPLRLTDEAVVSITFDGKTPRLVDEKTATAFDYQAGALHEVGVRAAMEPLSIVAGSARLSWYYQVYLDTGKRELRRPRSRPSFAATWSADGRQLAMISGEHVWQWDLDDLRGAIQLDLGGGEEAEHETSHALGVWEQDPRAPATTLRFLVGGVLIVANDQLRSIDPQRDVYATLAHGTHDYFESPAFEASPSGDLIFQSGGSKGQVGTLWRAPFEHGVPLVIPGFPVDAPTERIHVAAFSPSGALLVTGSVDGAARVWNTATGQQVTRLDHVTQIDGAVVSDANTVVVTSAGDSWHWSISARSVPHLDRITLGSADAINAGRTRILVGHDIVDETFRHRWSIPSDVHVQSATISADGTLVAVIDSAFDELRIFDARGQIDALRLGGIGGAGLEIVRPDLVLVTGTDGVLRFFRLCRRADGCGHHTTGEVLQLINVGSDWIAVDPSGRYDTSDLAALDGLAWVLPDRPFEALSADLFIRDYYVPGLVTKILDDEPLPPVEDLSRVDRRVPQVSFVNAVPVPGDPTRVRVTLDIDAESGEAYDLHLARDGNLIVEQPDPVDEKPSPVLADWRKRMRVAADSKRHHTVVIDVPLLTSTTNTELSAYAFNGQRLKGPTARFVYKYQPPPRSRKARAIIVTMGVNDSGAGLKPLDWAPLDATAASQAFATALSPRYDAIQIPLVSDSARWQSPCVDRSMLPATLGSLTAVLSALANKPHAALQPVERHAPCGAPPVAGPRALAPLEPDDVVVLYISAHGVSSGDEFAVVGEGGERLSMSSLARLLRAIPCDHIVVVLDTCESEAAVASAGFRPAPLGDFTFGQLAFDKSLQVLAASGTSEDAIDSQDVDGSLVVHSLRQRLAHGPVPVGSLLRRVAYDVPRLFRELGLTGQLQRPVVFDYRKGRNEVLLGGP